MENDDLAPSGGARGADSAAAAAPAAAPRDLPPAEPGPRIVRPAPGAPVEAPEPRQDRAKASGKPRASRSTGRPRGRPPRAATAAPPAAPAVTAATAPDGAAELAEWFDMLAEWTASPEWRLSQRDAARGAEVLGRMAARLGMSAASPTVTLVSDVAKLGGLFGGRLVSIRRRKTAEAAARAAAAPSAPPVAEPAPVAMSPIAPLRMPAPAAPAAPARAGGYVAPGAAPGAVAPGAAPGAVPPAAPRGVTLAADRMPAP